MNGITTYFIYTDEGLLAELDEKGNIQVAYGWQLGTLWGTSPLWQANISGNQTLQTASYNYLITDYLGTPQLAVNSRGQQTWKGIAEAFGKTQLDTANQITMNLRFPGQYFDKETNLHYNGFRHYNPKLGRYIQADPLGIIGGMNIYGYGYANPLFYYDPYGLWSFKNAFDPGFWLVNKILPDAVTNAITNDTVVNGVAGFGDTLSFDITRWLRGKLDVNTVDYCSDAYSNGQWAGMGYSLAFGGAHLGRNALYQMGKRGSLGQRVSRGVGRLFNDNRRWGSVRDTWSKAAGNGKRALQSMEQDLHHWLFPQRAKRAPQGLINSGFNYMPISAGLNRYMNGSTTLRTITEWGFKVNVIEIYGGLPTGIVSKILCDCK